MKTYIYKYLLLIAGIIITGTGMAQSADNNPIPFKEIHQKQSTDNFTARELKKKELEIIPAQMPLLNLRATSHAKKPNPGKRKRGASDYFSSLYIPVNFFDSRSCCKGFSICCASILNFKDRSSAALKAPVEI